MSRNDIRHRITVLALVSLAASCALAQTPTFRPMMTGHRVTCSQYLEGKIYAGMPKGGLVIWDTATGSATRILTRADGLSGHFVNDIAWTGVRLWVATGDGGMTSFTDPGGPNEFLKPHHSLLSSLDVTAVAGILVGDNERVYYGTNGAGIGEIVSGLEGTYYTSQDGLGSDFIEDLALTADLLLIATDVGLSRFADNTFTNYSYGDLGVGRIRDLEVGPDGSIWTAGYNGVHRWDDTNRTLVQVYGTRTRDIAVDGDVVWAATYYNDQLIRIVGGSASTVAVASAPTGAVIDTLETVAAGNDGAWTGGGMQPTGFSQYNDSAAAWIAAAGDVSVIIDPLDTCQPGADGGFQGTVVDSRNRPWLGNQEGDGIAGLGESGWYNRIATATVANDSNGFFDNGGGFLAMARDGDVIWASQFTRGAIRFVPAAEPGGPEEWLLLEPDNSPILGDGIVQMAVHPDGAVLFGTDASNFGGTDNSLLGVDVLFDPDAPRNPQSWTHVLPTDLGDGPIISGLFVERRDIIWIAVANVGLVRWDINGSNAGPDAPLTWANRSDDLFTILPRFLPTGFGPSAIDLQDTRAVALGPDGTLFAGGSGLVQFEYNEVTRAGLALAEWEVKENPVETGLLNQTVTGLEFDRNGALWVLTEGGLNRMRFSSDGVEIDAYTDLATYLSIASGLYSFSIISALPGGTYQRLGASADGSVLSLSSDLGGATVSVPPKAAVDSGDALAAAYLFPNPFPGVDEAGFLNIGGLDVDSENLLSVEVYNLVGQQVFRSLDLNSAVDVWDGRNRQDRPVASGLYIVKITYGGKSASRTLAIAY